MNRRDFLLGATALATTAVLSIPGLARVMREWTFDGPIFDGELGKYRGVKFVEQTTLHGKNWEWAYYADKIVVTAPPAISKLVEP